MTQIDEVAQGAYNDLQSGFSWAEIVDLYFEPFYTKEDFEYNNKIIDGINKRLPEDRSKFAHYPYYD